MMWWMWLVGASCAEFESKYRLGLDHFRINNFEEARSVFDSISDHSNATVWNKLALSETDTAKRLILHELAAAHQDTESLTILGYWYERGVNVPQDLQKACMYYRNAAKNVVDHYLSHPLGFQINSWNRVYFSQVNNGLFGQSLEDEIENMLDLNLLMARTGNPSAQLELLRFLRSYGEGIQRNFPKKARLYFERAASYFLKQAEASQIVKAIGGILSGHLGLIYLYGNEMEVNYELAFHWLSIGSNLEDGRSKFGLGLMYQRGILVQQDMDMASTLIEQAATKQYHLAELLNGRILLEANEVVPAYEMFERAAAHSEPIALYFLAELDSSDIQVQIERYKTLIEKVEGPNTHYRKALECYLEQDVTCAIHYSYLDAEQGFETAQSNYAFLSEGQEAIKYYIRSANQRNYESMLRVGDYFVENQEQRMALEAYQEAALKLPAALYNLGWIYETGFGVTTDFQKAFKYYMNAYDRDQNGQLAAIIGFIRLFIKSCWFKNIMLSKDPKYNYKSNIQITWDGLWESISGRATIIMDQDTEEQNESDLAIEFEGDHLILGLLCLGIYLMYRFRIFERIIASTNRRQPAANQQERPIIQNNNAI